MKKCNKCQLEKEPSEFRKQKKHKDGLHYTCKECEYGHKPHMKATLEKKCLKCLIIKPIQDFSFTNKSKELKSSYCKVCKNKTLQLKRMEKPEKEALRVRKRRFKHKYKDFSLDKYNELYIKQNGECKICTRYFAKLNVDHCHVTNTVRGLLCTNCNMGLGMFKDNSNSLTNAIEYLKETNTDKN